MLWRAMIKVTATGGWLLAGEVVTKYKVSYIGAPSPITLDTRASNEGLRILFYNHLLESTYQHLSYDLWVGIPISFLLTVDSGLTLVKHFQPGKECENFADGSFAALYWILHCGYKLGHEDTWILSLPFTIDMTQERSVETENRILLSLSGAACCCWVIDTWSWFGVTQLIYSSIFHFIILV